MLLSLIIFCELAFWLFLAAGLFARYVLKWPRTSTALLVCTPVVDVVLLIATAVDLSYNRATATFAHGLAAAYLGFTVAFGKRTIRWADGWFAHRFAGGPRPPKPPDSGREHLRNEWLLFGRALIAYAIALVLIVAAIAYVDDAQRTEELAAWPRFLTISAFFWFVFGPIYSTVFKWKAPVAKT